MTRSPDAEPDEDVGSPAERVIVPMSEPGPGAPLDSITRSVSNRPGRGGSMHEIDTGDVLGGYRVERRLGSGGMGEVFEATRILTGERVALKVLHATSPTLLYRFKREFRALAGITHANLISLYELCVPPDGPAFFAMELVEGERFTTYVRRGRPPGTPPDPERLEGALRQLVRGVHHLHGARCIHRDLKPSNVLVTSQGRVVILDFGLVFEQVSLSAGVTHDGQLLGTPAYMAPEQADAHTGPEVDYYAIGVMLYECLTGRLPFVGPAMKIIMAKQDREAPDLAAEGLEVPPPLRRICGRLLQRDPALRPTGRELLDLLGDEDPEAAAPGRSRIGDTRVTRRIPFVGREAERKALLDALHEVRGAGASITVHVHGPSGYGKSALVGRLLASARGDGEALVLHGRCFERESVPYKGMDAVVDALSVHLRRMSDPWLAQLRPVHLEAMTQIFPVLDGIWEPGVSEYGVTRFEPSHRRHLGLAALRELLVHLGGRFTLVVAIDDLQWANPDGIDLLTSIMRPPDPPALLLLLAFRDESTDSAVLRALTDPAAIEGRDVRAVEIGPLPDAPARALATALARLDGGSPARVAEVVRNARGSPFFIGQMSADARSIPEAAADLDGIVGHRITELEPLAHRILACIAVAGGPVPVDVIAEVVACEGVRAQLHRLQAMGMLAARSGDGESDEVSHVETAHDRIREVVFEGLDAASRRQLHLGLAEALERHGADAETLAAHYLEAGAPERAAAHTERAAERAAELLAFARAVDFYRRTLELLPADSGEHRDRIRRRLATQLVNVGHRTEAGRLLLELSQTADEAESAGLRREAANQLARSGQIDEAIELTSQLLASMGEPFPRTRRGALWMFLRERLRLWLRGWAYEPRPEQQIPRAQLERLDTLLILIDGEQEVMLATALHARALNLALELGEPRRLGLALGHEMAIQASFGRQRQAQRLSVEGRELAAITGDIELDLAIEMGHINVDHVSYRFSRALDRLSRIMRRFDEVPAAGWMRSHLTVRYVQACLAVGRWGELRRKLPGWLAIARDQGNLHEVASLHANAATVSLRYEDIEGARRHLQEAQQTWVPSHYTFTSMTVDQAELDLRLFLGEDQQALDRLRELRVVFRRWGLHRFRMIVDWQARIELRGWLQQALEQGARSPLLPRIGRRCRSLHRSPDPFNRADALLSEAALSTLRGDVEAARRTWRRAHDECYDCGLEAHLAAIRVRLAEVTTAHESRRLMALADEYFAREGMVERTRFVETFAPAARPLALSEA